MNKCGVVSPRFDLPLSEIEKQINNLQPSRQFGHIVITTSAGIMNHTDARRKKTGGKILGESAGGAEGRGGGSREGPSVTRALFPQHRAPLHA